MRPAILLLTCLVLVLAPPVMPARAQTPQPPEPGITSPWPDEALQGVVAIQGTSALPNFQSAEISFAYANNPTGTWFPITLAEKPVNSGALASWDTTTITDGDYALRLRIVLKGGSDRTFVVDGLRVRNYSPVETRVPTPSPTAAATQVLSITATPQPSPTPTASPTVMAATATELLSNPARLTVQAVAGSLAQGALVAVAFFAALGIYLGLKALWRRF
ncbi:MAG TPA: hypothetical protein VMT46_07260 [Anaerolineaceae bacterium]|nr:hypothetical protein [Anaerolineaceae bacterium]